MALKTGTTNKKSCLKVALAICIVAILALVWVNYVDLGKDNNEYPRVNEGITSFAEFDLTYLETGTSAKGTVFVMEGDDSLHIKIVANVIVGENDIGGALFYFTPELKVTDVLCSYNGDTSRKHVSTSHSPPQPNREYSTHVVVASGRYQPDPGKGMVIIDLELSGYVALDEIDSLHFAVSVGGKGNVIGMVGENVIIPILHDNAS